MYLPAGTMPALSANVKPLHQLSWPKPPTPYSTPATVVTPGTERASHCRRKNKTSVKDEEYVKAGRSPSRAAPLPSSLETARSASTGRFLRVLSVQVT
jgi:hypothetical protein